MTQNHHDAITAIELAIDEAERLNDCILRELLTDPHTAELKPIAVVSDNGPAFKADGFRPVHRFTTGADPHPHPA